jgi:hypothetical protein
MPKFVFEFGLSAEQLAALLRHELGSDVEVSATEKRVRLVESHTQGCAIHLKQEGDRTFCSGPNGYVPSHLARLGLLLGILALASLGTTAMMGGWHISVGGFIPLMLFFYLQGWVLPKKLVQRVSASMEKALARAADDSAHRTTEAGRVQGARI